MLAESVTAKLRAAMTTFFKENNAQVDKLRDQQRQLKEGEDKLDRAVSHLKQEQTRLASGLSQVQQKSSELRGWLEENEDSAPIDVDQAVYCKDTWSQQYVFPYVSSFSYSN